MLEDAARVAASALTPTAGENPTMVMHTAAVHSEAVSPNMAANLEPIKAWATACWEGWADTDHMTMLFKHSDCKLKNTQPNHWNSVNGPAAAAAVAATCMRLQWRSEDGRHFRDDVGMHLDTKFDPPQAFANATNRSATRLSTSTCY